MIWSDKCFKCYTHDPSTLPCSLCLRLEKNKYTFGLISALSPWIGTLQTKHGGVLQLLDSAKWRTGIYEHKHNQTLSFPKEILKNLCVWVGTLYAPANFVVIETGTEERAPIIFVLLTMLKVREEQIQFWFCWCFPPTGPKHLISTLSLWAGTLRAKHGGVL